MHTMHNKRARSSAHQSAHFVVDIVKMGAVDATTWALFDASCPDIYTLPSITLRNSLISKSYASYSDIYTLPSAILCLISRCLHPSECNRHLHSFKGNILQDTSRCLHSFKGNILQDTSRCLHSFKGNILRDTSRHLHSFKGNFTRHVQMSTLFHE